MLIISKTLANIKPTLVQCILFAGIQIHCRAKPTVSEYCFTSLSAQSWQYRDRRKPEAGTIPYSYFE